MHCLRQVIAANLTRFNNGELIYFLDVEGTGLGHILGGGGVGCVLWPDFAFSRHLDHLCIFVVVGFEREDLGLAIEPLLLFDQLVPLLSLVKTRDRSGSGSGLRTYSRRTETIAFPIHDPSKDISMGHHCTSQHNMAG